MPTGRVKRFDEKKGYGFIESEGINQDIFVHYSDIVGEGFRTLTAGEAVEFELIKSSKGFKATNVKKLHQ
ncbi:MAG: cold shock domain-containing protein [candidate division WOR-3 bacterium]